MNILPSKDGLLEEVNWSHFELQKFLPFRLNRVASEMTQQFADIYQEQYGLDLPEWCVLASLATSEPITAQTVVDQTNTHKSTVSRAVASLIDRGWVERLTSHLDRRAQLIRFTTEGRAGFSELLSRMVECQQDMEKKLGARGTKAVDRAVCVMEERLIKSA